MIHSVVPCHCRSIPTFHLDGIGPHLQGKESPVSSSGDSPSRGEHGRVKRYLTGLRKNGKSRKKLVHESEEAYVPTKGVNLRDVGAVTRGPMRELAVFRSSELLRCSLTATHIMSCGKTIEHRHVCSFPIGGFQTTTNSFLSVHLVDCEVLFSHAHLSLPNPSYPCHKSLLTLCTAKNDIAY